jgi:hypothetical protein
MRSGDQYATSILVLVYLRRRADYRTVFVRGSRVRPGGSPLAEKTKNRVGTMSGKKGRLGQRTSPTPATALDMLLGGNIRDRDTNVLGQLVQFCET